MSATEKHQCISQLKVERYLLGELGPEERARVSSEAERCADCSALIAETRADEEAFALRPVPERMRELWSRPPRRPWWKPLAVALPVAAAAAVALVLAMPSTPDGSWQEALDPDARRSKVRIKGPAETGPAPVEQLRLGFQVIEGLREVPGEDGQRLGEGARIQFMYDAPAAGPAVIVGIDGRRQVTRYFPTRGGLQATVSAGRDRVVESNVILDDAVGVERFFLCQGEAARDPGAVEEAARQVASDSADLRGVERLPVGCSQASFWIEKE